MGRPDDIKRRQNKKTEKSSDSIEIESLKENVNTLIEMQKILLERKDSGSSLSKEDLERLLASAGISQSDLEEEDPNKPKLGDFYINPASKINIKDSNLDNSKIQEKKVSSDNISKDVEKLKELLKKKGDK